MALIKGCVSHVVTLGALSSIAWYGHHTHWTFIPSHHDAAESSHAQHEHAPEESAEAHVAAPADNPIELSASESAARSGIELVDGVERPSIDELVVNGVTSYDEQFVAQLSSRVSGTVWHAEKFQGDFVRKGEVLVIVESEEVGQLKAEFLNSLVTSEMRRETYTNLSNLGDAVPGRQVREARAQLREADIRLMNAEQALVNLGFKLNTDDFTSLSDEQRRDRIRLLDLPEHLREELAPRHAMSNMLPLRAPFDGVVISRDATIGEVVEPGKPVYDVADVRRMWIRLSLRRDHAPLVELGQPVRFRADGISDEIVSRISWISTELDEKTRTLDVRAEFSNEDHQPHMAPRIRANIFGTGRITIGERAAARMVPEEAVHQDQFGAFVFVQTTPARFDVCRVKRSVTRNGFVEITGEIPDGARFAGRGSHLLKSQLILDRIAAGTSSPTR